MRRMLCIGIFFAIVSSATLLAQTDEKPIISVLDFKTSGISKEEVEVFIDFLSSHIVETGKYRVIDRMQREALLREMEFSYEDYNDPSCQLEIGRLLAANQIIVGSIGKVGERYLLTIKLISVETGETIKTGSEKYTTLNRLIDDSERLAKEFAGKTEPVEEAVVQEIPAVEETGERRGSAVEAHVGVTKIINPDGDDDEFLLWIAAAYVYQFSNSFSLGGWAGIASYFEPDYEGEPLYLPVFGAKFIFGNKVDGLAFTLNIGFPSAIGIYYRNFQVNLNFFYIEHTAFLGADIGYSFYFGK